jgi:hypothetical protein
MRAIQLAIAGSGDGRGLMNQGRQPLETEKTRGYSTLDPPNKVFLFVCFLTNFLTSKHGEANVLKKNPQYQFSYHPQISHSKI